MNIELICSVDDIQNSYIPNIKILSLNCDRVLIKMDIHKDLNPVEKGDKASFGIYKSIPSYTRGRDFVAHGYVITKRKGDKETKIYISLWGYLIIILTNDNEIITAVNPMDKVYIKLCKLDMTTE